MDKKAYKTVEYYLVQYHLGELTRMINDQIVIYRTMEPRWSLSHIVIGLGSTRTIFDASMGERYAMDRAEVFYRIEYLIKIFQGIKRAGMTLPPGKQQQAYNLRYVEGHRPARVQYIMGMKDATYYRLQKMVVYHFWKQIGKYLKK